MGRVWWFGPFVDNVTDTDWRGVVDGLYEHASSLLPESVDQEELAPDSGHALLAEWALGHGFHLDPGSAILGLDHPLDPPDEVGVGTIRPATEHAGRFIELHDELFAGTHTTGRGLLAGVDADHIRLVLEVDGPVGATVVGYVAVEAQPDGGGYIDFVGVDPAFRRHGYGLTLVRAGVEALAERGCQRFDLTYGRPTTAPERCTPRWASPRNGWCTPTARASNCVEPRPAVP
jgi:GNAT superfamily N-acetyltransferase